jgi:hypothetical protein
MTGCEVEESKIMRGRFDSGIYDPQTSALMKSALGSAWTQVDPDPRDAEIIRLTLAGAIIDLVDAGITAHDALVEGALKALDSAKRATRDVVQKSSGSAHVAPRLIGK